MKGGNIFIWNEICPYANPLPPASTQQLISRPGVPNVTAPCLALGKEVCVVGGGFDFADLRELQEPVFNIAFGNTELLRHASSLPLAIRSPPKDCVKMSSLTSGNHNRQLYLFCFYLYPCSKWQLLRALLYGGNVLVMQIALILWRVAQPLSPALQGILLFNSLHSVCSFLLIQVVLLIKIFVQGITAEQILLVYKDLLAA